jgi:hypothetical protein
MKAITRHKPPCQYDFVTTPLGQWATKRDEAILTPGGRYVKDRSGLPSRLANLFAELNGLGFSG